MVFMLFNCVDNFFSNIGLNYALTKFHKLLHHLICICYHGTVITFAYAEIKKIKFHVISKPHLINGFIYNLYCCYIAHAKVCKVCRIELLSHDPQMKRQYGSESRH